MGGDRRAGARTWEEIEQITRDTGHTDSHRERDRERERESERETERKRVSENERKLWPQEAKLRNPSFCRRT